MTDLQDRYEEVPTVPPTERPEFDPHTNWVNYWDVNPIEHGGMFVRWTGDMWECVEVFPPSGHRGPEHIVSVNCFEPTDVWENPDDPMTDFTDEMKSVLEALSDDHHLPNAPPFLEGISYYVPELHQYMNGRIRSDHFEIDGIDVDAYWDELSSYGVEPDDVEGVLDKDLPE